ncbi:MAG: hypothetical protein JXR38_05525, partial [Bacilli bacterium]|nr:hypothetical protein [Bacilli bacterium]
ILGLVLCIVVAYRDSYHLSVMAMTDPSLQGGVFAANSFQSTLCMILGAVNMLTVLSAVIIRKASYREWMFYVLAAAIIIKVLVIESSLLLL